MLPTGVFSLFEHCAPFSFIRDNPGLFCGQTFLKDVSKIKKGIIGDVCVLWVNCDHALSHLR